MSSVEKVVEFYPRWMIRAWATAFLLPVVTVFAGAATIRLGLELRDFIWPVIEYSFLGSVLLPWASRHPWDRRLLDCITSVGGFCVLIFLLTTITVLLYGLPTPD